MHREGDGWLRLLPKRLLAVKTKPRSERDKEGGVGNREWTPMDANRGEEGVELIE